MSIDGIGKPPGGGIGGIGGIGGVPGKDAASAAEPFKLDASAPSAASGKVSAALSSLQRGELSLDQYLDSRVSEAVSHLVAKLSPDQLEFVKQSLRDQMATDPVLVELVQRTTGPHAGVRAALTGTRAPVPAAELRSSVNTADCSSSINPQAYKRSPTRTRRTRCSRAWPRKSTNP